METTQTHSSRTQNVFKRLLGLLGLGLLALSFLAVRTPAGLESQKLQAGQIPLEVIYPAESQGQARPLVLIGHGFAGSSVLMRGFAYTLAKAGYVTAVWDFDGHGRNPAPLPGGTTRADLVSNAEQVLQTIEQLGLADVKRVAILGHSMGSGVALTFGQRYPQTTATIAVSPVGVPVTPQLPRNLLLMAGSNEPAFLRNAQERLQEAGGAGGDPANGSARALQVIPYVEHVTIVFAPAAHHAASAWLEDSFGVQAAAQDYTDRRILWYGLGLAGAILAALFLVPGNQPSPGGQSLPGWRRILALAGGALGASLLLGLLERLGADLSGALGLMVGGYLLIWFGVAGLLALLLLGRSAWKGWPGGRVLLSGFLVGLLLWVGIGLLGGEVWLAWQLIPARLVFYPLALLLVMPWLLAVGIVNEPANPGGRLAWWLGSSVVMVAGLLLAMQITNGLFFLTLILPIFPLVLGLHALAAGRQRQRWAFALSAALLVGWMLLAVFPLA